MNPISAGKTILPSNLGLPYKQPRLAHMAVRLKGNLWSKIRFPLAIATVLSSTWGPGLKASLTVSPAKIFVVLSAVFVLGWLFFERNKRIAFPRVFTWYVIFVLIHTAITYGFFYRNEISFDFISVATRADGAMLIDEGMGIKIVRLVLFVLFGYALSSVISNRKDILSLAVAYVFGFLVVILTGGHVTEGSSGLRYAGGFLDPNAFAFSAVNTFFLGFLLLISTSVNRFFRTVGYLAIMVALFALFRSGSRGGLVGLVAGITFLIIYIPNINKRLVLIYCFFGMIVVMFAATGFKPLEMILERMSGSRLEMDQGSGREDLWMSYSNKLKDYFIVGTGHGRSLDVIQSEGGRIGTTHNDYLGNLVQYGIVGFALFLYGLGALWRRLRRISQQYLLTAAVIKAWFIAWLVQASVLDTLSTRDAWIVLAVTAAAGKVLSNSHISVQGYGHWRSKNEKHLTR
ncbi:O-antigen ligase domain-containing protein [bacterium]|nr:MAG: O-antigen ligase domain-containing protein [bacterium]